MAAYSEFLKTTEAAVVAGVALREVNRVIDEGILPKDFVRTSNGRFVVPAGCMLIAFYFESAGQLTVKERRFVIHTASDRLRDWTKEAFAAVPRKDWTVKHEFLAVDFAPFVRSVTDRLEKLSAADDLISTSPDVLSGTPVIKGTRIPVHDIAASVEAGISNARILSAYPSLNAEKIDLAALYAKANPARGRPRGRATLPPGTTILADRRAPRRRKAG